MSAKAEIPSLPNEIRRAKFLKHLRKARLHLTLVNHLIPDGCQSSYGEAERRLLQIDRFSSVNGGVR